MAKDDLQNDVSPADPTLQEKTQGKNILHAPQGVTAPPATPSWQTNTTGSMLTAANTTELTAMYQTLLDIYNALLKEGLIKKK